MRPFPWPGIAFLLTLAVASGCGGGEDDGDPALPSRSDLAGRTATAFEGAGLGSGRVVTSCFALDEEGRDRVADALGIPGAELDDPANLTGTTERGDLVCSFVPRGGATLPVSIRLATTDDDLDGAIEPLRDSDRPVEITERDAPGLEAGTVVGIDQGGEFGQALWVQDGVLVAVGGPPGTVDLDTLVEALPVLVEEVDRVLAGS